MKKIIYLLLTLIAILSLTACKGKTSADSELSDSSSIVESTVDPFAISAEIEIDKSTTPTQKETLAEEVEVLETYADGSYSALLADGSTIITSSAKNLIDSDKLTEDEALALDNIVGMWRQDSTLSKDFLKKNITKNSFPSLSDGDCSVLIDRIQKETPHTESETVAYTEQTSETTATQSPDGALTMEEIAKLSQEEKDAYVEKMSGGGKVAHPDEVDIEVAKKIKLQGAQ